MPHIRIYTKPKKKNGHIRQLKEVKSRQMENNVTKVRESMSPSKLLLTRFLL